MISSGRKDPELFKKKNMTNVKGLEVCRNVLFSDLQEIVLNSFCFEIDSLLYNFPPASSPNLEINPQNILTFSFNPFATLPSNFLALSSTTPKLNP